MILEKSIDIRSWLINTLVLLVLMGQPNGIYLLFPAINALLIVYILGVLGLSIVQFRLQRSIVVFIALTTVFLLYSLFSLSYASDPMFGLRILMSVFFKFFVFLTLVTLVKTVSDFKGVLRTIIHVSVFFCITGIVLTLAVLFFHLQPSEIIGEVEVGDKMTYDQSLSYYRLLGFVRSSHNILSLVYPRLQSFFIEPGYFSFFLELSIFSTLAYLNFNDINKRRFMWFLRLQVFALMLSLSLAGVISVLLGYFFYLHFSSGRLMILSMLRFGSRVLMALIVSVSLLYMVASSFVIGLYNIFILERFTVEWGASSADVRGDVFRMGIDLWKQAPILGHGFNQVRVLAGGSGTNNSFLSIAAEGGLIGLTMYLAITAYAIWAAVRTIKVARRQSVNRSKIFCAIIGGLIAQTFHCILMDTNWTFIYWVMLALVFISFKLVVPGNVINRDKNILGT